MRLSKCPKAKSIPIPATLNCRISKASLRSDKERKLITMHRTFQLAGAPFVLPPGTPQGCESKFCKKQCGGLSKILSFSANTKKPATTHHH